MRMLLGLRLCRLRLRKVRPSSSSDTKTIEANAAAIAAGGLLLLSAAIATGRVSKCSSDAKTYSPSTSATEMKAAPSTPLAMLGSTIRTITVNQPAPSDRAASDSVATSIAERAASMDR